MGKFNLFMPFMLNKLCLIGSDCLRMNVSVQCLLLSLRKPKGKRKSQKGSIFDPLLFDDVINKIFCHAAFQRRISIGLERRKS